MQAPAFDLARLLAPLDAKTFLSTQWEREPLVLHRKQPDYFRELLDAVTLDRVVTSLGLHHPAISVVRADKRIHAGEYTFPSGMLDVSRVVQQFADGGTLVFSQLDLQVAPLARLCRSLEHELGTRFQTNVYYTPPNAQGFPAHYDSHDVFVLQCEGEKHWRLYDTPVELPYRNEEFSPHKFTAGAVTREFVLGPGDIAYVPRGLMHDARNVGDTPSLHITLGVLFTSWSELVLEAIARVGLKDPRFRKALPPGFARADFDRTEARATFRALLRDAAEQAEFDPVLEHFIDDMVTTRHPVMHGSLLECTRWAQLTLDDRVGVRPSVLYRLREDAEHVVLSVYSADVRFPAAVLAPLRFCLEHDAFTARELPGSLDEEGRLTLVRRLLREGVLTLLQ